MADVIELDAFRPCRAVVPYRPIPDETLRQAADRRMVDKVLAWVECKMETTLHRPLEPRDRVIVMRMLALAHPEPHD